MPSKSLTYQVLIASPSDLSQERKIVVEAIADWNAQHAVAEGVVLLPVMWETHARPQSGIRPQEAINQQIVRGCDFLVGIFWSKIGTNTGIAESGTVEEIDEFVAAGKPALLYFSDCPIAPSKIDLKQLEKLKSFKDATYQKALTGSFADHNELRQKLVRDMLRQVRELKANAGSSEERQDIGQPAVIEQSMKQREYEYGMRDRIKEALSDPRYKWRTLKAVVRAAGVPKEQAERVAHLLQADPSVRFTTNKGGEILVGLRSRVDRVEVGDARSSYPEHGDRWGNWEFDAELLVLKYRTPDGDSRYEIDLETITSSAQMLDWIFQIAGKAWASPEVLGNLVLAFDDLIRPQANLCSWGQDISLDVTKLLSEHLKTREKL